MLVDLCKVTVGVSITLDSGKLNKKYLLGTATAIENSAPSSSARSMLYRRSKAIRKRGRAGVLVDDGISSESKGSVG